MDAHPVNALATKLVTVCDIAASRVRDMPVETFVQRKEKMTAYVQAMYDAKRELERGEWSLS